LELLWVIFLMTFVWHCSAFDEGGSLSVGQQSCSSPSFAFYLPLIVLGGLYSNELLRRFRALKDFRGIKHFYETLLRIDHDMLLTMDWSDVVSRLRRVPCPGAANVDGLVTELDICNRIMRRENLMIAMVNDNVMNLRIPMAESLGAAINSPEIGARPLLTKTVEWGLQRALFNFAFSRGKLNPAFRDPSRHDFVANQLRSRFRFLGVAALILSPFVFLYLVVFSMFQYGEELRHRPTLVTARRWTATARWKFRQFNELPHLFRRRLNAAIPPSQRYVATCFPGNKLGTVGRFVSLMCGSLIVLLLFGALLDDEFLGRDLVGNKSGAWVLGVCTALLAVARSVVPDDSSTAKATEILSAAQAMEDVVEHTHYFPLQWRGRTHTVKVKNEFTSLFTYSANVFLLEICSVLLAPLVFMFSLPKSADRIVDFLRSHVVHVDGVEDIVDAATFPTGRLRDINKSDTGSADGDLVYNQTDGDSEFDTELFEKLEASFLSFKATYPTWEAGHDADDFIGVDPNEVQVPADDDMASGVVDDSSMDPRRAGGLHLGRSRLDFDDPEPDSLLASQLDLAEARREFFRKNDRRR
jgi:autophagy-related protein 9